VGIPAGLWYHILLHRMLVATNAPLPSKWWLHPVREHECLGAEDQKRLLPAFRTGALGSIAIVVGAVLVVFAICRAAYFGESF
jgi:hypothetical protein